MYVYVCVYTYVCMYIYIYIYIHTSVHDEADHAVARAAHGEAAEELVAEGLGLHMC